MGIEIAAASEMVSEKPWERSAIGIGGSVVDGVPLFPFAFVEAVAEMGLGQESVGMREEEAGVGGGAAVVAEEEVVSEAGGRWRAGEGGGVVVMNFMISWLRSCQKLMVLRYAMKGFVNLGDVVVSVPVLVISTSTMPSCSVAFSKGAEKISTT